MKKVSLRGGCILLVLLVLFSLNTPRGVAQQQILGNPRISFSENPSGELTSLGLSNNFKYIHTDEIVSPASIVTYKENSLLLAQYQSLTLLDIFSGKQQTINPENLAQFGNVWNPTGIFYDIANNKLYLANYNGHNILIGSINDKGQFHIEQEIIADGMISPENVVVSNDGNMIAVADYDGNSVFVFDRDGSVLWKREVLQAHGIEIDEHAVYCTSLTSREVISFDLKGNEKKRVGQLQSSGKNGYMWPVALEVYGDQLLVVDAHASRITVLDTDLNYQTVLGSYGPYVTNLNYPYAAIVIDDDIFIADTKGKRIIQIDLEGNILAQWSDYKPLYPETCQGYIPDSSYVNHPSPVGTPVYSPFVIAQQAIYGASYFCNDMEIEEYLEMDPFWSEYQWINAENAYDLVQKEPAYQWLRENSVSVYDSYVWQFQSSNAYNDVFQKAGWQSSFWQRYIIDAFSMIEDLEMVKKAAYAYGYKTKDGGLSTISKDGSLWFEEVPNNSHILNAHIASLVGLYQANELCKDQRIASLYQQGVQVLRNNLYRFDTGYWTKYDMNPQKSILFELSWDGTDDSPMIDTISLYDPVEDAATQLNIGDGADYDGVSYIAGLRWKAEQAVDGCMVRTFSAYSSEDAANGVAAYLHLSLPQTDTEDWFDTPDRLILIRYKDTSSGTLQVLRQSIAEGNVLEMVPLQNAIIHCTGDGEWKTAVIPLRAQDLGWYMGPDYQAYHIEQLAILAEQTGDWYFRQTVQRWEFYLEAQQKEENS